MKSMEVFQVLQVRAWTGNTRTIAIVKQFCVAFSNKVETTAWDNAVKIGQTKQAIGRTKFTLEQDELLTPARHFSSVSRIISWER